MLGSKNWIFILSNYSGVLKRAADRMIKKSFPGGSFITAPIETRAPLVSIILVLYKSNDTILEVFDCIKKQTYQNIEIVIIDNHPLEEEFEKLDISIDLKSKIRYFPQEDNMGFAEACNIGLNHSVGDYIALLNPDAFPNPNWIENLLKILISNPKIHAASPKLLFDSEFSEINIKFGEYTEICLEHFVYYMSYKKIFVRCGSLIGKTLATDAEGLLKIDIPSKSKSIIIKEITNDPQSLGKLQSTRADNFSVASEKREIILTYNGSTFYKDRKDLIEIELNYSHNPLHRFSVINNAGSSTKFIDQPFDIEFSKKDPNLSLHYKIRRICGCAPIFSRHAFVSRSIFIGEFFAYYEDSELSRHINRNNILYYSSSTVVRHKHSTVLGEFSPTWSYLVERSKLIYHILEIDHYIPDSRFTNMLFNMVLRRKVIHRLSKISNSATKNNVGLKLVSKIQKLDMSFEQKLFGREYKKKTRTSIGIFNLYWNTYGGGESHALVIASRLKHRYPDKDIFLISETDFDLHSLGRYFEIDTKGMYKYIVNKVDTKLTKQFWLFINSTYCSSLTSKADISWYLVSFPHRKSFSFYSHAWTKSYNYFLTNSDFTNYYTKQYWRYIKNSQKIKTLYPVLKYKSLPSINRRKKERIILNVARFSMKGHPKRQDIAIKAFIDFFRLSDENKTWKLVCAGSLNMDDQEDIRYFEKLKRIVYDNCMEESITISENISRELLTSYYERSWAYIHATGFLEDKNKPQKQEHFGIAVYEAVLNNCYPIVYNNAGPKEIIDKTGFGESFSSHQMLVNAYNKLANSYQHYMQTKHENSDENIYRIQDEAESCLSFLLRSLAAPESKGN